ncbi:hypothetical protein OC845_006792 [Tilletia horrida]|nr:hypothetical protein OC845_006792 [Tilletia horrida]
MQLSGLACFCVAVAAGLTTSASAQSVPKDLYLKARADGSYHDLYHRDGPSPNNRLIRQKREQNALGSDNAAERRQASPTNGLGLPYPTDEASFAKVSDIRVACNPYYLPEIGAIQNNYPAPWLNQAITGATIMSGDSEAQSVWQSIQSKIPSNVAVKQRDTSTNTLITSSYDVTKDPDCWWTASQCHSPKHNSIPQDVGPNCTHNAFYDFLEQHNQKATLYYIGSNVLDWPLQAQRGLADGHQICVHTWSHQPMTTLSSENVFAELWYTAKIIKDVVGVAPRCWRPPYGDVDDRVRAIANALGLATHIWTADTNDYLVTPGGPSSTAAIQSNYASIFATASASPSAGIIVLTHEINAGTMNLFESEYANIIKNFKHVVPITACLNESNPYEPNSGISYPGFSAYISGQVMPSGLPSSFSIKNQVYNPLSISSAAAAMSTSASQSGSSGKSTSSNRPTTSSGTGNSAGAASVPLSGSVIAGLAVSMVIGTLVVLL